MSDRRKDMTMVFKALCNEYRLQAVELLRSGERCAADLQRAIGISQPNLSHHMKVLMGSGIVVARQEGKRTLYSINQDGVMRARVLLEDATAVHAAGAGRAGAGHAGAECAGAERVGAVRAGCRWPGADAAG